MNGLDLRQLRYFVAVAEELHFGRAAARLGIAQPPLSQQVRRLEARLGVRLLDRDRRHVALTDAGRALLGEGRRLLAEADRVEDLTRRAGRGEAGPLTLGFVGSAAYEVVPVLLRALRTELPDVRPSLVELSTTEQVDALRERSIDAGVLRAPVGDPDVRLLPLVDERMLAALPDFHPLAAGPEVALAALAGEPFVLFAREANPPFFDDVMAACREAGFSPAIAQVARSMPTIVSLVAAGLGVALVPAAMDRLRLEGVAYVPLAGAQVRRPLALAWRGDAGSALVERLAEVARAALPGG